LCRCTVCSGPRNRTLKRDSKAIGKDSYTEGAEEAPVKETKKEEKKIDTAEDKQITSAQNK